MTRFIDPQATAAQLVATYATVADDEAAEGVCARSEWELTPEELAEGDITAERV